LSKVAPRPGATWSSARTTVQCRKKFLQRGQLVKLGTALAKAAREQRFDQDWRVVWIGRTVMTRDPNLKETGGRGWQQGETGWADGFRVGTF
jgi:hypothetical protein